jgi:hypothetical protein
MATIDVDALAREVEDEATQEREAARGTDDDPSDIDGAYDEYPDEFVTDDGDTLPDEVQAELEALAASELDVEVDSGLARALAEAQREIARQRNLTRQAISRYREALLAAEPELPADLMRGESIEEVDAAAESARRAVTRIRERLVMEHPRPFPVGAPARDAGHRAPMSAQQKIVAGLQERMI